MNKRFLAIVICVFAIVAMASVVYAQAKAPATPQATSPADQAKQTLVNNFSALQNQEARVIVLQQLMNREIGELRQMQAVFCDQYSLNLDRWRNGGYQYDMKEGKFIERPIEAKKP